MRIDSSFVFLNVKTNLYHDHASSDGLFRTISFNYTGESIASASEDCLLILYVDFMRLILPYYTSILIRFEIDNN